MSAFGIVSDFVVSSVADPVGNGSVLVHLLGQGALGAEGLVGWHGVVGSQAKQRSKSVVEVWLVCVMGSRCECR